MKMGGWQLRSGQGLDMCKKTAPRKAKFGLLALNTKEICTAQLAMDMSSGELGLGTNTFDVFLKSQLLVRRV